MQLEIFLLRTYNIRRVKRVAVTKCQFELEKQPFGSPEEFTFQTPGYTVPANIQEISDDWEFANRICCKLGLMGNREHGFDQETIDFEMRVGQRLVVIEEQYCRDSYRKLAILAEESGIVSHFLFPTLDFEKRIKSRTILNASDSTVMGCWKLRGNRFEIWWIDFDRLQDPKTDSKYYHSHIAAFDWATKKMISPPVAIFDLRNSQVVYLTYDRNAPKQDPPIQIGRINFDSRIGFSMASMFAIPRCGFDDNETYDFALRNPGLAWLGTKELLLLVVCQMEGLGKVHTNVRILRPDPNSQKCVRVKVHYHDLVIPWELHSWKPTAINIRFRPTGKGQLIVLEIRLSARHRMDLSYLIVMYYCTFGQFCNLLGGAKHRVIIEESQFGLPLRTLDRTLLTHWWARRTKDTPTKRWVLTRIDYHLK